MFMFIFQGNESLLEHLSHPVNQFQLIKRFADDWVDVAELLQEPLPTPPDLSDFNLPSEEILGASQVGRKNNFNLLLNSDRKI